MNRRTFLAVVGAGATASLAGCTGKPLSNEEYDVGMYSNRFEPRQYEVQVGDTVTWGNTGSRVHSVTAYGDAIPDGADYFASGDYDSEAAAREGWPRHGSIDSGETYSHTFEVAGEYDYFCIPHEAANMVGKIVVSE